MDITNVSKGILFNNHNPMVLVNPMKVSVDLYNVCFVIINEWREIFFKLPPRSNKVTELT